MQRRFLPVVMSVVMATAVAVAAEAGVEPSPFRVRLVKLQNVSSAVLGANTLMEALFAFHPPEPGAECPRPEAVVPSDAEILDNYCMASETLAEELRSLAKQVQRLEEVVYETIPDTAGAEDALADQLEIIVGAADELLALIDPPIDWAEAPEDAMVANARAKLRRNAQTLRNTAALPLEDAR